MFQFSPVSQKREEEDTGGDKVQPQHILTHLPQVLLSLQTFESNFFFSVRLTVLPVEAPAVEITRSSGKEKAKVKGPITLKEYGEKPLTCAISVLLFWIPTHLCCSPLPRLGTGHSL